jgi:hypothetical protein
MGGSPDGTKPTESQLPLLTSNRPSAHPPIILDERLRGTRFVSLTPQRVLNSPKSTGMEYWSLNPYVGCEFGCTYCYARYTHRYVVERAHDAGKITDAEFSDYRGAHGWRLRKAIFVRSTWSARSTPTNTCRSARHRDRHGDRPISARRTQVLRHSSRAAASDAL